MERSECRYLDAVFAWKAVSFCVNDDTGKPTPVIVNGYWQGFIEYPDHYLFSLEDLGYPSGPRKNVFKQALYSLRSPDSDPVCICQGTGFQQSPEFSGNPDCIQIAVGREGVVCEGKYMDIYYSRVSIDHVNKILEEATLIGRAMKILMDSRVVIADEEGEPFYMRPLREALACETPEQIQMALLRETVEEGQYTFDELLEIGFSDKVIEECWAW